MMASETTMDDAVLLLARNRTILPIDVTLLRLQLQHRKRVKYSCWVSKKMLADEIGRSPKTIMRSWARQEAAGLIERKQVPVPDPDDPENLTGWRMFFLWLVPDGYVPGPGPDRPGKGVKRGPRKARTWWQFFFSGTRTTAK